MSARIVYGMRSLGISIMLALGAACCADMAPRPDTPGSTVARHLQERYAGSVENCLRSADDPAPLPAVLCSGILLRVSRRGPGFDIWNPNPNSSTPNGVPFMWLRQDAKFSRPAFGYTSGFIFLPYFYADSPSDGYTQLMVLCVFAFDGATNDRTGDEQDGCGAAQGIAGTGPCQDQGINTAAEWLARFRNGGMYGNQCGFRLLPNTPDAWQAFKAHWEIRQALPGWFHLHNEVVLRTWAQGDTRIPLEAFFYVNGDAAGLLEAKQNQVDFKARTGRWVPVIRADFPTSSGGSARFSFNDAEQGIPE